MGLFDNLERGLERAVRAPFAKVFKAEVQPVEIASHIRGAMDERAAVLGPGRTMVPNVFSVELATTDYERLSSYDTALTNELVAAAEDHADSQRYTSPGPMQVRLTKDDDLETGIFRVKPASKEGQRRSARATSARRQRPEEHQQEASSRDADGESGDTRAFPATSAPSKARQHTRGPQPWLDIDGRRENLQTAVTLLGRDASAAITIDDPGISRRHAEIRVSHDGPHLQVLIRDAGSTNGTFLNGDSIGTEELNDGDRITLGRTTLIFHLDRN
ncbi:MAG: DUF3662 and FHA domain-containing protein [Ornithinimicrobium sp.]